MQAQSDSIDRNAKQRSRQMLHYYKDVERSRKRSRERSAEFRARFKYSELRARNPARHLYWACFSRAKKKGLEMSLTQEWIAARYKKGCAVTGIPFADGGTVGNSTKSASIDRIDNSKGYTQGNCRLVLYSVNMFKGTMTDVDMREIAAAIVAGVTA
jgi:hypothetical protein